MARRFFLKHNSQMAFYLEKAIFHNRAPFEHLEIDFKKNGISVLTAINGKGKTTILSHIVDAFYELARNNFPLEFESRSNDYYRVSSGLDNINMTKPSFVYLRFINENSKWDYIDIRNKCTEDEYNQSVPLADKIPYQEICNFFNITSNIKHWYRVATDTKKILSLFKTNILTYFPAYRYELPSYLNDPYKVSFEYRQKNSFDGKLINPIEVISDIHYLSNWILDVALDALVNNNNDDELILLNNLNTVLSYSLSSKKYEGTVRFGIGERNRGASRICIMNDVNNQKIMICPSIFNLSSGELSLMSIFGEILRQADNLKNNIPLNDIQGIVLIDEVDKHLHITLQKEVLPKLFNLFPNVQFIVSSHSPFLNMGLADEASERSQIIDLDNNGIVCEPTNNDRYKEVYDMMVNENQRFYSNYQKLQGELDAITKPIVITEGKTDIMHILKAKEKLGIALEFDTISPDNQPDGESDLQKLLEQLCKVKHNCKVIAIFDRDIPKTVQTMDDNGTGYKSYGNNVYGFCISAPQSRIDNGQDNISIEYLYSDDEIHTRLSNGCQLFFGDEFLETSGRHRTNRDLVLKNQSDRGKRKIVENNGGQAVYDLNDNNILAKKSDFAEAIKNDQIVISQESWDNFKPIFDKIQTIINL